MLELMLCSLVTILPDYLYRRYRQGKRFGKEITFFSVWYELRWGITGCLMLTISLITMIFYFHPSTTSAAIYFRTVPIMPEGVRRPRRRGQCRLQRAGEAGRRSVPAGQFEAGGRPGDRQAQDRRGRCVADLGAGRRRQGRCPGREAKASLQQAKDEFDVKSELQRRNPGIVPQRDIEKLQVLVDQRQAGVDAATAARKASALRVSTLLPAEKASAEAALAEAQVELDKTCCSCRRRWPRRAIPPSRRRRRQPAACGRPES